MSLAAKVIWKIERNLGNEISLSDIVDGGGAQTWNDRGVEHDEARAPSGHGVR